MIGSLIMSNSAIYFENKGRLRGRRADAAWFGEYPVIIRTQGRCYSSLKSPKLCPQLLLPDLKRRWNVERGISPRKQP